MSYAIGDWVRVKPAYDIPPMFRPDGKPTRGRIASVDGATAIVDVPIGDTVDPLTEHSQAVPYGLHMLVPDFPAENHAQQGADERRRHG